MIDRSHSLPVTQQAQQLGISRGSVYYRPRPVSATDLAVMRRIDELHKPIISPSSDTKGLLRVWRVAG